MTNYSWEFERKKIFYKSSWEIQINMIHIHSAPVLILPVSMTLLMRNVGQVHTFSTPVCLRPFAWITRHVVIMFWQMFNKSLIMQSSLVENIECFDLRNHCKPFLNTAVGLRLFFFFINIAEWSVTDRKISSSPEDVSLCLFTFLLSVPRVKTKHREAAFSFYAPHIWNKVPENFRSAPTLSSSKSKIKTFLFTTAIY